MYAGRPQVVQPGVFSCAESTYAARGILIT
nr:MAG TPA: hypothetical protein [Caudoviricetes sp.]DAN05096.1 MAG TPA: hypothetical protein [Caudoviricetes sp.]DAR75884.1 MAG TPA: hypothetical protein [Caudoviricetes sp.]DAX81137.1 MAG TPA: hypothetical protein [Caudoviricetes sp.]DAY26625.1 MAG TPA: hypothetical protein [Caudoviricetes sp.]